MPRTEDRGRLRAGWMVWLGIATLGLSLGSSAAPVAGQEVGTFQVVDFGVFPRPSLKSVLLGMDSVKRDLKITEAQEKQLTAITEERQQKINKARRENSDNAKIQAAFDTILKDSQEALQAVLTPEQHKRLDGIQLQAQGPRAFVLPDQFNTSEFGVPIAKRLELSDEQAQKIREIAQEGINEIGNAASFSVKVESKEKPPSIETLRKLVESQEFQAAKKNAAQAGRDAWAVVMKRIDAVLTDAQREAYHKFLGAPFDLSTLRRGTPEQERQFDLQVASREFGNGDGQGGAGGGQGGGQRADPNFDTKVARPAYGQNVRHPRVLFDEAHHNFHTASGRYMPFASLITNDGYEVIPNKQKFSRAMLEKGDILVIANALGAEGMGQPGAANPAFTDEECDAVRDWINAGGSLLLITDHAPMGSAAQCLAKRFDVSMSTGATGDPQNSEGGETSLVFTRQNHLLGDHPITRGRDDSERVNRVRTFTGTSLKGPAGSVPILKLADTAVDHSFDDGKSVSAAGRAQGLALSFGKGRVVVLGEAAELSAQLIGNEKFGMNVPGLDNRQMALNVMHWLSGVLEPRDTARN